MERAAVAIELTASERQELEALARARKTGHASARRVCIILAAAGGHENKAIRDLTGADINTIGKWRRRFANDRLDELYDEPRPGTPRSIGDDEIAETIRRTLEETPSGAMHWSLRSMAQAVGHRRRRSIASGKRSGYSRTGQRPSNCRAIRFSWRRSATGSRGLTAA